MKLTEGKIGDKKIHLERLLALGTVMVFVDSRHNEVIVPPQHKGMTQLPLNFDYGFNIPDFKVCDNHIEASLSFNRQRFFCILPYKAVYALNSQLAGEVIVFPEDMPEEMRATLNSSATIISPADTTKPAEKAAVSNLSLVVDNKNQDNQEGGQFETPKKKSHLKLVKSDD